jgi:hypothetical protein
VGEFTYGHFYNLVGDDLAPICSPPLGGLFIFERGGEGKREMKNMILLTGLFLVMLITYRPLIVFGVGGTDTNKLANASQKEEYDLQERCNRRALERFKQNYGDGLSHYDSETHSISSYRTHYNRKFNKCFVLLNVAFYTPDMKGPVGTLKRLVDINENVEVASFINATSEITCWGLVRDLTTLNHCRSEAEWDSLVRPYMAE